MNRVTPARTRRLCIVGRIEELKEDKASVEAQVNMRRPGTQERFGLLKLLRLIEASIETLEAAL